MASVTIPTNTPGMEALLIAGLSSVEETFNIKPEREKPFRFFVIRADLQQKVTPISRYCRVGISTWSVRRDGTSDIGDAFDLAASGNAWFENNVAGLVLSADVESGPSRVTDPVTKLEYLYSTVLLEVAV